MERVRAVSTVVHALQESLDERAFLKALRFERKFESLTIPPRPTNLQELLNQATTCLVLLAGCRRLFQLHPEVQELKLAWMEEAGPDIRDAEGLVEAECFAATHSGSNDKLKQDVERLAKNPKPKNRYVFFYAHEGVTPIQVRDGVTVIQVDLFESLE